MKKDFVLSTDTSCDVPRGQLTAMGIPYIPLTFTIGAETFADEFNSDSEYHHFYEKIRAGAMPITSQINIFLHEEFFEKLLETSDELVHLTLSGGLSNTYNSAKLAADNVMERLAGKKIYIVDTLSATQGHCAVLDEAIKLKSAGLEAKAVATELESYSARLHHWILVDDLMHLKRGGRVSAVTAHIGSFLKIKPVLVINNEGKLAVVSKAKGTHKGLKLFMKMLKEYGEDVKNSTVYIAHADNLELATELKEMVEAEYGCNVKIGWIGPVIGSHTGCGTLGLVFKGSPRLTDR